MVGLVRYQHNLPCLEILIGDGILAWVQQPAVQPLDGGEVDVDRARHRLVEIVHGADIHQRVINPDLRREQILAGCRVQEVVLGLLDDLG